mgnify:FL=1
MEGTDFVEMASAIWSRRAVKRASLSRSMKNRLAATWNTAAFDVYLRCAKPRNLKSVWQTARAGGQRSTNLMTAERVLAECLILDSKGGLANLAIDALQRHDDLASRLARELVGTRVGVEALFRVFLRYKTPKRTRSAAAVLVQSLRSLLAVVEELLRTQSTRVDELPTVAVALCRLAIEIQSSQGSELRAELAQAVWPYLTFLLRSASGHDADTTFATSWMAALSRGEHQAVVQAVIRETSARSGSEYLDAASNVERLNGKLEVLLPVVGAIAWTGSDRERLQRIQSALYNLQAREDGLPGQDVRFDPLSHEISEGVCHPGEPANLVVPAWYLGGRQGVLLKKAVVRGRGSDEPR